MIDPTPLCLNHHERLENPGRNPGPILHVKWRNKKGEPVADVDISCCLYEAIYDDMFALMNAGHVPQLDYYEAGSKVHRGVVVAAFAWWAENRRPGIIEYLTEAHQKRTERVNATFVFRRNGDTEFVIEDDRERLDEWTGLVEPYGFVVGMIDPALLARQDERPFDVPGGQPS